LKIKIKQEFKNQADVQPEKPTLKVSFSHNHGISKKIPQFGS
jgi:hypothetical protein